MKLVLFKIRFLAFLFALLIIPNSINAKIRLASMYSDHMVLQQKEQVPIWGWAEPGSGITISCSWEEKVHKLQTNSSAKWSLMLHTPEAGGPYTITIAEKNIIILHDVWIGEVWLCSGQSNMEWSTRAGILNAQEEIKNSNQPLIRYLQIPKRSADNPQEEFEGQWDLCSPETMPGFSAISYFFAKELTKTLGIPVGIIHSSWGGSAAEAWTPKSIIASDPEYSKWSEVFSEDFQWPYRPATTYNGMIHPLIPFKIAGVLWYQGESNTGNPIVYRRLFPDMIKSWRTAWGYDFPFYFAQIAPFNYGRPLQGSLVQEAQRMTLHHSLYTGMAVTTDIGDIKDIHPKNKQEVGRRLALWALAKNYDQTQEYSGPLYRQIIKEGNKIRVILDHTEKGLIIKGDKPELYKIAGTNKQFVEAKISINDHELVFSSDLIPDPVAVRYAFDNIAEGNLYNAAGLPASPFRSDDWPILFQSVNIKSVYDPAQQGFIITMDAAKSDQIVYTLNGHDPAISSQIYSGPFVVKKNAIINAKVIEDSILSEAVSKSEIGINKATFKPINYISPNSPKYNGTGTYNLINGIKGSYNPNDGQWQGWEGIDMEVIVDLGEVSRSKKVEISFLENQDAWIFLPAQVEISISSNGKTFSEVLKQIEPITNSRNPTIKIYKSSISSPVRFVKIIARNIKSCPPWHPGAGSKSWVFADEISVE